MKITKRQALYSICFIIIACCVCLNLNRDRKHREAASIEASYRAIYETERKQELSALQRRYDDLVSEISDRRKTDQWRETRLKELCEMLGFDYGYHGQHFLINDFANLNREYRGEDLSMLRKIAEHRAKIAEQQARESAQK